MKERFPPTVIWRHRKENLKKCSLSGLENRPDFAFYSYPTDVLPDMEGYILLDLDAPPLVKEDRTHGLFILDATWRHAEKMMNQVPNTDRFLRRSIPAHFITAYPRKQDDCSDPDRGLASIEAIYIAYCLLGRETDGLLDHYYWKEKFLNINPFH